MAEAAAVRGYVGQSILRREDDYLLRGQGRFVDDLPEPRDTLFLGFVMSPHAHARIESIDAAEAKALPGIVDVLTGEDLAKLTKPVVTEVEFPGYIKHGRLVLARGKVRFVGEHVAVVIAEDRYIAQDAVELVRVAYAPLPAAADLETAHLPGAPLVHDDIPDNTIFAGKFQTPDFEAHWAAGELSLRERFRSGRVAGVPIEPRGCLAMPEMVGDSLVFYSSTQVPHLLRTALAVHIVGAVESKIRVVVPEVGGGFGTKAQIYTEEIAAAALALKLRRPIKWIQDRREELLTSIHARDHLYDVEAKHTQDGVVTALRLELFTNAGAYSSLPFGCTLEPSGGARMIVGPYRIRHYAYRNYSIATHTCPSGAYRGVAQPTCFMAIEGMMDRIARRLGLDPAEVRRRNMIRPEEMPWVNAVGVRYDTGSYLESMEKALQAIGYDAFRERQPADRLRDGQYRGVGIACFTEVSGTGAPGWRARGLTRMPGFDSALIKVEPTGKVTAYISHANGGQGHYTTFAQLVADSTGAALDDVTIVEGDTAATPYGTNTFASRSAVTGGGAVIRAGRKVKDKMRRIAAELLEVAAQDVVIENGVAHVAGVPDMKLSLTDIAETAYSMNNRSLPKGEDYGLEAVDMYDPPLVTMANAVHVCAVAVDPDDARVTIESYVVVHDCGRIINPVIVDGQVQGGTAQGIGEALMEELVYDSEGQLLNANLLDYLLPTAEDVPDYQIHHIETPTIDAEGGFKGVGEGGVIGAVPAVVNAVADALAGLGANVNRIPLRPSYLHRLMRAAKA
jgi:carbon-monoxide dehydrogenase large subunit